MQTQKYTTCKQILKNKKYAYKIIKKIKQYEAKPTPYQKGEAERLAQYIKTTDSFYPKKPIFTQSKKMGLKYFIENMDRIIDQGYISITNGKGKHIKLGIPRYFRKKLNELFPEKYELLMEKLNLSLIELHSEIKQTLNTYKKTYEDLINYSSRQVHKYFSKIIPKQLDAKWKGDYELDNKTIYEKLPFSI